MVSCGLQEGPQGHGNRERGLTALEKVVDKGGAPGNGKNGPEDLQ